MAKSNTSAVMPVLRFVARHTVSVHNVKSKFTKKEDFQSQFSSLFDPLQPTFVLVLNFGTEICDLLNVYVFPTTRETVFTKIKCDVFNDKARKVGGHQDFEQRYTAEVGGRYGFGRLVKSEVLSDKVKVTIEIEYEGLPSVALPDALDHQCLLGDDYTKLLESGQHVDVTILIGKEKIMGHKCVLAARCSYFERMFQTNMEGVSCEIEVPDIRAEIFRGMLKYLYSGQPPKYSGQDLMDLIAVADKYGVDQLKKRCESTLCSQLSRENVIEVLLLADRHGCSELVKHATTVLKMYKEDLKGDKRWKQLKTNPDLLLKLFDSC